MDLNNCSNRPLTFWAEDFLRLIGFTLYFTIIIKLLVTLPLIVTSSNVMNCHLSRALLFASAFMTPHSKDSRGPKFAHKSYLPRNPTSFSFSLNSHFFLAFWIGSGFLHKYQSKGTWARGGWRTRLRWSFRINCPNKLRYSVHKATEQYGYSPRV